MFWDNASYHEVNNTNDDLIGRAMNALGDYKIYLGSIKWKVKGCAV